MKINKKIILCLRWDPRVVLMNQAVKAFRQFEGKCSSCGARVLVTEASHRQLQKDAAFVAVCIECAGAMIEKSREKVRLAVLPETIDELKNYFARIAAQKN